MIVYFIRGLFEKDQKEVYMSDLHRDKTTSVTQEYFRRHEKATLQSRAHPGSHPWAGAQGVGAAAPPPQPMRSNLIDFVFTDFEE